jgi:hypothetical protein
MMANPDHSAAGILISLDALIANRAEQPTALEEAPVALRRIGWMGRPIILVGERVANRELPAAGADREAWVRAAVGVGAYSVVAFEERPIDKGPRDGGDAAVEGWRELAEEQGGTWLVTEQAQQVGPAHKAGLKVILIGPNDAQPWLQRPDYQARDLRDAVGHLLAEDVFAHPATASTPGSKPTH